MRSARGSSAACGQADEPSTHRSHAGEKGHKDQVASELVPDRVLASKLHAWFRHVGG